VYYYLDCDTGIDDAIALALLLATPGADLAGIGTVSGNTSAAQAARNTLGLLALAGRSDIPVAVGAHHPLDGTFEAGAEVVHGDNGIGGVDLPPGPAGPVDGTAAELLIRLAREHPGELRVIATGPLTNLALALRAEPELTVLVKDVTVMGGAVRVPGNVTGDAEANIAGDPRAAAQVFGTSWPITLVPLDVTMNHRFDLADQQALLTGGSPLTTALGEMLTSYFDFYEGVLGVRETPLHDPLAAGLAVGLLSAGDAPMLGLRVDDNGKLHEEPADPTRTRVVLTLGEAAAPLIRTRILAPGIG
jgi:purine nucleosidase